MKGLCEKVIERLSNFGYEISEEKDVYHINYLINKRAEEIKSYCNIDFISDKLEKIIVENVSGEFLHEKKGIDDEIVKKIEKLPIKSVKIGDTSTTFKDSENSYESRFDELTKSLMSYGRDLLDEYRSIRW